MIVRISIRRGKVLIDVAGVTGPICVEMADEIVEELERLGISVGDRRRGLKEEYYVTSEAEREAEGQ